MAMTMTESHWKIDCYTHFAPPSLSQYLSEVTGRPPPFQNLFDKIPLLTMKSDEDASTRLQSMDEKKVACQVLVPLPWLEDVPEVWKDEDKAVRACNLANADTSALVAKYPSRFVGVALIPTAASEDAIMSVYRHAISDLKLCGVVLFVGPQSVPPDTGRLESLYEESEAGGTPIWLHPCRPQSFADYDEYRSEGSMHAIWNSFGWVYDTSVAMVHIVMAGILQRYPKLKFVSHHEGGMIPFFSSRFYTQMANFDMDQEEARARLRDLEKFYCDTATFGYNPANIARCLDFFRDGRVMFGTDTPMDMSNPGFFVETSLQSIADLIHPHTQNKLNEEQLRDILLNNALCLLGPHADHVRRFMGLSVYDSSTSSKL